MMIVKKLEKDGCNSMNYEDILSNRVKQFSQVGSVVFSIWQ